jgi:hypothetical protein
MFGKRVCAKDIEKEVTLEHERSAYYVSQWAHRGCFEFSQNKDHHDLAQKGLVQMWAQEGQGLWHPRGQKAY